MSTNTENNILTNTKLTENYYLNTLINENEQLKKSNNKLYKRTLNLKRKNLRLKKIFNANNSSEQNESNNSLEQNESYIKEPIITDVIWEDVNDLIQSYETEDKINQVAENLVQRVFNDYKKKTE